MKIEVHCNKVSEKLTQMSAEHASVVVSTDYYTTLQPFYGPMDCVQDYPGELVPER